jgi:pyruvate dehydrogenase E1 component alpha subunit
MSSSGPYARGATDDPGAADELRALYERMAIVRRVEARLSRLFADGEIPGFIHLAIGQEATAVGVAAALRTDDTIASTHRGHGHALAKGLDLSAFFRELLGRAGGLCEGRGGSMHVADTALGMLGANGIVGAGIPIALGSALAHQLRGGGAVAVAFFGDGAAAEGVLHETLNLGALWKLPLLFVCEHNGWSEFSPSARQLAATLSALAGAYGIPHAHVDGDDVEEVATTTRRLVSEIRRGGGPRFLESATHRVRGHYEGDPQKYRDPAELERLPQQDPLLLCRRRLLSLGVAEPALDDLLRSVDERIEAAVATARAAPLPEFEAAARDVYAAGGGR